LPGWTRFPAAQEWLDQHQASAPAVPQQQPQQLTTGQNSAPASGAANAAGKDQLFKDFLKWQAREHP